MYIRFYTRKKFKHSIRVFVVLPAFNTMIFYLNELSADCLDYFVMATK
jgi:hypothetical protein